jgi:hypothetical protein
MAAARRPLAIRDSGPRLQSLASSPANEDRNLFLPFTGYIWWRIFTFTRPPINPRDQRSWKPVHCLIFEPVLEKCEQEPCEAQRRGHCIRTAHVYPGGDRERDTQERRSVSSYYTSIVLSCTRDHLWTLSLVRFLPLVLYLEEVRDTCD